MVISILSFIQSTSPHPVSASSSPPCTPSHRFCSSELSLFSMSLGDPRMFVPDASLPSSSGLSTPSSRSRRPLLGSVFSATSALLAVLPRALPPALSLPARPRKTQTVRQAMTSIHPFGIDTDRVQTGTHGRAIAPSSSKALLMLSWKSTTRLSRPRSKTMSSPRPSSRPCPTRPVVSLTAVAWARPNTWST